MVGGLRERASAELAARPRHIALGALAGGLLASPHAGAALLGVMAAAGVAGAWLRLPWPALLAVAAALAGGLAGHARLGALDATRLDVVRGTEQVADVTLLAAPRDRPFGGWWAPARLATGPGRDERIVLRVAAGLSRPQVGAIVRVHGRLAPLARWEGAERVRGAHAALVVAGLRPTGRRRAGVLGVVDALRRRAERALELGLSAPDGALARGMVLGQDEALEPDTRDAFRATGLTHLLAASGQNVTLLALFAAALLAALGAGLRGRLAGALVLVGAYVPLAGGGPSIVRAGIMGAAGIVAALAGRPGSRAYALLFAAAATLALNPRSSADVGWQLSFAAVLAIALLAGRWREALERRRIPRPLAEAAALTAAATAGTAPLIALHFSSVSLVSVPANLLATPAVAPVVWLGTGSALLGQLPSAGPALWLAEGLDALAAVPLGYVGDVAAIGARMPGATVAVGLAGPAAVAALYAVLGAAVTSRRARLAALGALAAALAPVVWGLAHPPGPPRDLTVSFLDVGQGDATLIQHGRAAMLVDTGPPGGPVLARLRHAGVRRLDVLVLTHAQADHEGAAPAVLAALPVGAVLDGGDGVRSPERTAIAAAESAHRVRRLIPDAGTVLRDGPLRVDVLWPHREPATDHAGADPNARAIVARVSEGAFSLLLTADAESDVTLPLGLRPVTALKVAHHGSADAGLPALLARLRPAVAAISVGAHNTYGHPAPQALRALRVVPRVLRTDRDGTVRLSVSGGRVTVRTHA